MVYWIGGIGIIAVLIIYIKVKHYTDYQAHCIEDLEANNLRIESQENQKMIDLLNDIKVIQKKANIWANHDTEISKLVEFHLASCSRRKYQLDIKKELSYATNEKA